VSEDEEIQTYNPVYFVHNPVITVRNGDEVALPVVPVTSRYIAQAGTSGGGADESAAVDCSGAWSGDIRCNLTGVSTAFQDIADASAMAIHDLTGMRTAFRDIADAAVWTMPEPFSWSMVSYDAVEETDDGMAAAFEEVFA